MPYTTRLLQLHTIIEGRFSSLSSAIIHPRGTKGSKVGGGEGKKGEGREGVMKKGSLIEHCKDPFERELLLTLPLLIHDLSIF